ncbi:hypothetical protein ACI2IX_02595 [Leifsonia aquatica]|uniref:hypothetical protein n=1 Tax=Leifsonia aquatica TaxID=144185 RepID=UPI00384DC18A
MTAPNRRISHIRQVLAAVLVTAPVGAIVWSTIAWLPILPDELPSQWRGDEVVSHQPTLPFAIVVFVVAAVCAALAWVGAVRPHTYERPRRVFLIGGSVAAVAATAWLISAVIAQTPTQAIGAAGLLLFVSMLYGPLPFVVGAQVRAPGESHDHTVPPAAAPALAWSRSQWVPLFVGATALAVMVAIAFGYVPMIRNGAAPADVSVAVVATLTSVLFFSFARVHVVVDARGLRVRSTTLGARILFVRLADIASARAADLDPMHWGGWGYRVGPRGSAVILRSGSGLVVTRTNGAETAVTVPDADEAVSVLEALRQRSVP